MLPKRLIRAKMEADERELLDIAARSIALMGTIFFFENEPILHFYVTLTVLNIAERTGSRVLMARSYGHLTVAMAILNRLRLFRLYERLCREAFDESFRIEDQVTIYKYWVIAYISLGRWREAIEWCQWGVDACLRLGDRRQWKENLSLLGIIKLNLGQFSECVALREEFYQASLKDKDTQSLGWAYTNRTLIALMQNRYEEALNWCQETEKLGVIVQPPEIINSNSFFAMSYLYTGQIEEAKRCVFASYNKIKEVHPAIFYVAPGYIMTVQVLMTLWLNGDPDVSEELVVDAMDSLEKFAKAIAIGRPRMYLHKGIYALVKGDKRKAIQFWEKGVEEANVMETPFEAAWLHYELGKHVGDEVTRQQHVQLSLEKFALFSAKGTDYPYQLN